MESCWDQSLNKLDSLLCIQWNRDGWSQPYSPLWVCQCVCVCTISIYRSTCHKLRPHSRKAVTVSTWGLMCYSLSSKFMLGEWGLCQCMYCLSLVHKKSKPKSIEWTEGTEGKSSSRACLVVVYSGSAIFVCVPARLPLTQSVSSVFLGILCVHRSHMCAERIPDLKAHLYLI